ncbi:MULTISPECIES: nitroreductase family deazaflavin-dependent oxidoreductase [unclassified Streptomyces]|uniref:nitroreductase family deazaflavin-dependent oxidoreductase n=1 Tax=unclassified Streptomyces TaxID=2593676 RepID=UPI003369F1E1
MSEHHIKPGRFDSAMNATVSWLARRGVSFFGTAELSVVGRKTGEWRRVPVNPLSLNGERYLVSPRGASQWVRNMRAAGGGRLQLGRRRQTFTATELPEGAEKTEALRAYLDRWGWEVKSFFDGATAKSSDDELARISPLHPVFRITTTADATTTDAADAPAARA